MPNSHKNGKVLNRFERRWVGKKRLWPELNKNFYPEFYPVYVLRVWRWNIKCKSPLVREIKKKCKSMRLKNLLSVNWNQFKQRRLTDSIIFAYFNDFCMSNKIRVLSIVLKRFFLLLNFGSLQTLLYKTVTYMHLFS